ncbi:MAG: hypothetical protein R6X29_09455 [Acidimicrobiia bacterium]|jgi:hypothetical protein
MTYVSPLDSAPVLWTRGEGCQELAAALSVGEPVRVVDDLVDTAVRKRAGLLVARRLPGSDLLSVAVPVDLALGDAGAVVAAVAGGPHSLLAAGVAARLGDRLGVAASMVCAVRPGDDREQALAVIEDIYRRVPVLEYRIVEAEDAQQLVGQLPDDPLLVLGAPGGNWFQRVLFGRGVRLRQRAPNGAVVVRAVPPRVFGLMGEPVFISPLREAGDVLRTHPESVLAVVEGGVLVGLVRREVLQRAAPGRAVSELMDPPVSVSFDATIEEAAPLFVGFGDDPVPVAGRNGELVGGLVRPG